MRSMILRLAAESASGVPVMTNTKEPPLVTLTSMLALVNAPMDLATSAGDRSFGLMFSAATVKRSVTGRTAGAAGVGAVAVALLSARAAAPGLMAG